MRILKSLFLIIFLILVPYKNIFAEENKQDRKYKIFVDNYDKCIEELVFISSRNFKNSSCSRAIEIAEKQKFNEIYLLRLYYYVSRNILNNSNNNQNQLEKDYAKSRELALKGVIFGKNPDLYSEEQKLIFQALYDIIGFTFIEGKDYENALINYQKSLEFAFENNESSDDIKYNSQVNMGYAFLRKADYSSALDIFTKILDNKRCKSSNTFSCLIIQNNIANVYYFLGDKFNEKYTLNSVIQNIINNEDEIVKSKNFKKETLCSMILNGINLNVKDSIELFDKNCSDVKDPSPDLLLQLADLDFANKRYLKALEKLKKGKSLLVKNSDSYIEDKIIIQLKISENLFELNQNKEALKLCVDSLNLLNKNSLYVPAFDRYRNICLSNLILKYKETDNDNIWENVNFYIDKDITFIANTAPYLSLERRSEFTYQDIYKDSYDAIYSLDLFFSNLEKNNSYKNLLLSARVNRNGLLEDIERRQTILENSNAFNNFKSKKELQVIFNKLFNPNIRKKEIITLNQRKKTIEKDILSKLPKINYQKITVEKIKDALPLNSVLIEFQKYRTYSWDEKNNNFGKYRYKAIILSKKGGIEIIDLGESSVIDSEILKSLNEVQFSSNKKKLGNWDKVSSLLLKPINQYIKDNSIIYLSFDSNLNFVPINLLRNNEGVYYSEIYELRAVSSARELIALKRKKMTTSANKSIVLANPSFDEEIDDVNFKNLNNRNFKQIRSSGECITTFQSLQNTKYEGKEVARILNANLFSEKDANSLTLQNLNNSPRLIHIATHGFFCEKPINSDENPLNQVGLVLAGANSNKSNSFDDGFLTAMEITKLNLTNTELVVLSTCDSAKGFEKGSEGIIGLRRSLAVAGARSSILSLWKIDDEATSQFMINFYKRLKSGESRLQALLNTQKDFRSGLINNGFDDEWKNEYYWGAFQLSGDWRPIDFN